VTRRTPPSPRVTRSAKNSFQARPVSAVATRMPRTSRCPPPLTPVATSTTALMTLAAFTDFHRQGVGSEEREWAGGVQGSVPEVLDDAGELAGHRHRRDGGRSVAAALSQATRVGLRLPDHHVPGW
jgi:hypothetical protein